MVERKQTLTEDFDFYFTSFRDVNFSGIVICVGYDGCDGCLRT